MCCTDAFQELLVLLHSFKWLIFLFWLADPTFFSFLFFVLLRIRPQIIKLGSMMGLCLARKKNPTTIRSEVYVIISFFSFKTLFFHCWWICINPRLHLGLSLSPWCSNRRWTLIRHFKGPSWLNFPSRKLVSCGAVGLGLRNVPRRSLEAFLLEGEPFAHGKIPPAGLEWPGQARELLICAEF